MREGWCKKALSDVATIYNGNSINAEEKKKKYLGQTQGLPFIATKDVGNDGSIDYENGVRIPNYIDFKIAYPDSVFVCAEGGSAGKKVAFVEKEVCFGNKLFALQPKKALLNGKYLYYFVQSQSFKEQFKQLITGIIGGVSSKKFKEIPIILSSLPEQQRIVDILDQEFAKIDALKANAEKSLQAAKDLFQAALKKELEPREGWRSHKLNEIYDVRDGTHDSPQYHLSGYPLATSKNLRNGIVDLSNVKLISKQDYDKINERSKVDVGDLLFAMIGTIGNPCLVETEPNYAIKNMALFKVPKNQSGKLLKYILSTDDVLNEMRGQSKGANQPFVSLGYLRNYIITIPNSFDEQVRLVVKLDDLNDKCNALQENYQKTLSLCDDLKQSLLRKAFNGEL